MPQFPAATSPDTVARDGAPMVLLRSALKVALPLAALLVIGSFVVRGVAGGVTAAVTAVALLGIQYVTAWAATVAGRVSPQALQAVTMFGFLGRLVMYGVLVAVFNDVRAVDGPVLATVVVSLVVAILVAESRVAMRYSKFWWQATGTEQTTTPQTDQPTETADAVAGKD